MIIAPGRRRPIILMCSLAVAAMLTFTTRPALAGVWPCGGDNGCSCGWAFCQTSDQCENEDPSDAEMCDIYCSSASCSAGWFCDNAAYETCGSPPVAISVCNCG
jgi:hypothetical protein